MRDLVRKAIELPIGQRLLGALNRKSVRKLRDLLLETDDERLIRFMFLEGNRNTVWGAYVKNKSGSVFRLFRLGGDEGRTRLIADDVVLGMLPFSEQLLSFGC